MNQILKNCWPLIILTALLCLGGCLDLKRKTPVFYYYTLEYGAPQFPKIKPLNADIYVERFVANSPYDTDLMVYRHNEFERDAYHYHRWRTRPAEMISSLLARDLRESRTFHRIYREFLPPGDAYGLKGVVEDFLEWDSADRREAVLRLRIILTKGDGSGEKESPFFEKTYFARKAMRNEGPNGLARAMSQALEEVSIAFITDIHHVLQTRSTAQ